MAAGSRADRRRRLERRAGGGGWIAAAAGLGGRKEVAGYHVESDSLSIRANPRRVAI
jgi:hypothetical protein